MSGVHDAIVVAAWSILPEGAKKVFEPFFDELKKSSWYPDQFADPTMPSEKKAEIDPEADRFIYPRYPDTEDYRKILTLTAEEEKMGVAPLRDVYLAEHYLRSAVESLRQRDYRSASKFCGVYSHVIADIGEPIHAVNPAVVDLVVPPPTEYLGMELHANVEGLKAPVSIQGYVPELLGQTISQAVMGAYRGLVQAKRIGAALVVPIVQALYNGDLKKAVELSGMAQSESARHTADFMHTAVYLALRTENNDPENVDLCDYPHVRADVDMLYRYRPMVDISLIPYSGGKFHPLSIMSGNGGTVVQVHGLGVVPYLGPPRSRDIVRRAEVEFYLVRGAYSQFKANIGLNPLFEETTVRCVFSVLGDGKELFRSPEVGLKDPAIDVRVGIANVTWLTLSMHCPVNPTFADVERLHCRWAPHGVWAEPTLG